MYTTLSAAAGVVNNWVVALGERGEAILEVDLLPTQVDTSPFLSPASNPSQGAE